MLKYIELMNDVSTKRVGYLTKQIKTLDQFLDFLDRLKQNRNRHLSLNKSHKIHEKRTF